MNKEDAVCIYNPILLSHKKQLLFVTIWLCLEITILSEVSQTEENKYHIIYLYEGSRNIIQMNLFTKLKQNHRHRKQTYGNKDFLYFRGNHSNIL